MREALIVWGGWSGHEPEQCAGIVAGMLEEEGFKVHVENTTAALAAPALADMSLVVPIVTMSKIEKEEVANLAKAVRGGVGLAGFHGGMCDAFREAVEYQFMCGGQWVAHPGNIIDYRVNIAAPRRPSHAGHRGFRLPLRAVLHARGPLERGARHHHLLRRARRLDRRRRHAGGLEAPSRPGPRVLQLARTRRERNSRFRRCAPSCGAGWSGLPDSEGAASAAWRSRRRRGRSSGRAQRGVDSGHESTHPGVLEFIFHARKLGHDLAIVVRAAPAQPVRGPRAATSFAKTNGSGRTNSSMASV